jgi:hypothetical protein
MQQDRKARGEPEDGSTASDMEAEWWRRRVNGG